MNNKWFMNNFLFNFIQSSKVKVSIVLTYLTCIHSMIFVIRIINKILSCLYTKKLNTP